MVEGDEQPAIFSSIPVSMWWAIETLTTVGYGDMVPVTTVGKILGGIVSIVGIGTLALFSGVITVGFLDQVKAFREQNTHHGRPPAEAGSTEVAAAFSPVPGICPHCGGAVENDDRPNSIFAARS